MLVRRGLRLSAIMSPFIMISRSLSRLLEQLEATRRQVGAISPASLQRLLSQIGAHRFRDAASLARFHDALLFLVAFPPDRAVLRHAESLLSEFESRVKQLQRDGADLSRLNDEEETSGIAGTTLTSWLHYDEARWVAQHLPRRISVDWNGYENHERMAAALPRFLPLLEEDALVEADVPYLRWIQAASGGNDLEWLLEQLDRLPAPLEVKAEIYGALDLPVRINLERSKASRTLARRRVRTIYFHRAPLIRRAEVSLADEFARPPLKVAKLSRRDGEEILNLCREATTVRYRELYGTTRGDPSSVVQADVGRGVQIFLWGLPPERRLPLRAYQAGFTLKNGVPINYIEGISLFEWMEIGFNTFYAYRDGETAWIYAQALRLLRQVLGVSCISVYPYQIGQGNEEAIKSGAFWFYRKLGFRPMRADLAKLVAREEKKIAANPAHRTPASALRRIAQGHVVYEAPGSASGTWDGFQMRNIGIAIQRRMAARFQGNADRLRRASLAALARNFGISPSHWSAVEKRAFENFSLVLGVIPESRRWSRDEKELLLSIVRAKAHQDEPSYAHLLGKHSRLRKAILGLETEPVHPGVG
jgi:hypothetical protein